MKKIIILLWVMAFGLAYGQNIVQVEYFFDSDPGYGQGTPISISSATEIEINESLDISALEPGFHSLHLRSLDESGNWSQTLNRSFFIAKNKGNVYPVDAMEYFFNQDPGYGQGIPLNIEPGPEPNLLDTLDLSQLMPGFHSLHLRAHDENGNWSSVLSRSFYIPKNRAVAAKINTFEYFYDEDPGFGQGRHFEDFTAAENIDIMFAALVDGLEAGNHRIFIRAKTENNFWSQTYSQDFLLMDCDLSISGRVTNQEGGNITDGFVVMYLKNQEGYAVPIDTSVITTGQYAFSAACPKTDYFLKAFPESQSGFIPTYFGDSPLWREAETVHTETGSLSDINIQVYRPLPLQSGTSSMGGHIYLADGKGEPVKNVDIYLEMEEIDKAAGYNIVDYQKSNEYGSWQMAELPNGNYRIKVDITGLNQDTTYYVNIKEENTVVDNLDFYVDYSSGIYIGPTGIAEPIADDGFRLYPNPASQSNVWIESQSGGLQIEYISLYDQSGQRISQVSGRGGKQRLKTGLLPPGLYLVRIHTKKGIQTKKLIIR